MGPGAEEYSKLDEERRKAISDSTKVCRLAVQGNLARYRANSEQSQLERRGDGDASRGNRAIDQESVVIVRRARTAHARPETFVDDGTDATRHRISHRRRG